MLESTVKKQQQPESDKRSSAHSDYRVSIAPMMELTDRHFRFLARLLSKRCLLYTEMVTSKAVIHGDQERLLGFNSEEHPVALQLGGSDPAELAMAAVQGVDVGYDEINLNVGCPSDRVKSGRFGACLMAEPELVGQCLEAMAAKVDVPVTVKCRIGIDRDDSQDSLNEFVHRVAAYGCRRFIVHARKAWLDGLSPKENRTIPPLRYETVYALKREYPSLTVVINGGITSWQEVDQHLENVDGVMIGREAYYRPSLLLEADQRYGAHPGTLSLEQVALNYAQYMQDQMVSGVNLSLMTRHLIALFQQVPGAKAWRRHLSEQARFATEPIKFVNDGLELLERHAREISNIANNRSDPPLQSSRQS